MEETYETQSLLANSSDGGTASEVTTKQDELTALFLESHNKAVDETVSVLKHTIIGAFCLAFTFTMRTNIFVLYARSMNDYVNETATAIVVYLNYIFSGLMSLSFGYIGDYWRFDILLIIASIFDVITFWIEATTDNYIILSIAYVIGGQPIQELLMVILVKWHQYLMQNYYNYYLFDYMFVVMLLVQY